MKFRTKKRTTRNPRRKRPSSLKRRLNLESLESRQLLAVDGFTIDLSGGGTVDLLNPTAGTSLHELFASGNLTTGSGITLGTSNVPGQNNENPITGDDAASANENGPAIAINVSDVLANDVDPDDSGTLFVVSVSSANSLGTATLDSVAGTILYDPSGAFDSLPIGQTATDVFQYTVDDTAGGRGMGNVTVTITGSNDAPTITGVATASADEGSIAIHGGMYGDIDTGDTVALTASEGSVVDNDDGSWSWSLATTDDSVARPVTITATDDQDVATDFTFQFTVDNVTPSIALTGEATVNEAATYTLTLGSVSDPGNDMISDYIVDWGDGSSETYNDAGSKIHVYADGPNDYTIRVSLTDEDGTHADAGTLSLAVNNVAPLIAVSNATVTTNEGETASNAGTFSDVGNDSVTLTASVGTVVDAGGGNWNWSLSTTDGPSESQTVTITATDSDNAVTTSTFALVVNNVIPNVSVDSQIVTVNEGVAANNTGMFSDASGDTVTLTASVGEVGKSNDGTWAWSFDSTDGPDETQLVTITATDQDSGQNTTTFDLVVDNLAPVAAPQSIEVLGNVPITRAWSTLLVGATDAGDDALSVKSIDTTTASGTLTLDTGASTFRYVPTTGFEGTTSFDFTIEDSDGATHQETATITIDRSLWVVDNSAGVGGDGSMASPFQSFTPLNDLENAPDVDESGDIIFVVGTAADYNVSHGAHNDHGFKLEDSQFLIGSGLPVTLETYLATHSVSVPAGSDAMPTTLPPGPTLTNTTGDVVTVTNNNTIAGFATDPTASAGIAGENVSGLTVEFVIIITSGGDGNNEGIRLKTVTGTMTFNSLDIGSADGQTNSGAAIQIDGGTANINFNDVDIDQDGGSLLEILNTAASTISFDENSELTLQGSDEAAVTITGNNGGTVTLNNDGFSADTTAAVTFNISGNTGLTATTPVNDAPVFVLQSTTLLTLEDGGSQTISSFATDVTPGPDASEAGQTVGFNVLTNDNESLFVSQPALDPSGNLTFTLADGALGTATIEINLSDDGGTADGGMDTSETQSFTIQVVPVNDAPSFAIANDPASVPEDAGVQTVSSFASNLATGPTDESGQSLTFEVTGNTNAGLFAIAPTISPTRALTYPPANDVTGTATVSGVLKDDGGTENGGVDTSVEQSFVITVSPSINDAPSFTLEGDPDRPLEDAGTQTVAGIATSISPGPTDEASQTVAFVVTNDHNDLFSVQPSISADGTLTYTPAPNQSGSAVLTVTLQDNGGTADGGVDTSASQSLTIHVDPVNDAPVLVNIPNINSDELQSIEFTASASDVDIPANTLTFSLSDSAPNAATLTSGGVFSWMPSEADGGGTFTFDITVSDGELEHSQSITITVNEVNVAPVFDPISNANVDEGSELSFTVTATDSDLPANTLVFNLDANAPAGAAITQSGDFTWTPTESQGPGTYDFKVLVSDATVTTTSDTITITVVDVNNAPSLATIGNQNGSEHQLISFTASASDSDLPADTLTFSLSDTAPTGASITHAGDFTWTPSEEQSGTFTFDVIVSDGNSSDSEEIEVTVAETNETPVLSSIGGQTLSEGVQHTFTATASDSDVPTQVLEFTLAGTVPAGATITDGGVFAWTPSEVQQGTFTFDIVVSDGQASDSETITWTVAEVNDDPVLASINNQVVNENDLLTFTATATDSDVPTQNLTFTLNNAPAGATMTPGGVFMWTPGEDDGGKTFDFTVSVSDGITSDSSSSITITVNQVNDPPVLATIENQTGIEHQAVTFTALATDADLPNDTLTFSLSESAPPGANITSAGDFSWTPSENQSGVFTFDVVVSDGQVSDSQAITVNISETNDSPVLTDIAPQNLSEGQAFTFTASATDTDAPTQDLTFSLSGAVPTGAAITTAGVFTWTPTEDQDGTFQFEVLVSDGQVSDSQAITLNVAEVNQAPVLAALSDMTVSAGDAITFNVNATDADLPANNVTLQIVGRSNGDWIITDGAFSWTPTIADIGDYVFDVTATDNGSPSLSDTETITITVADGLSPLLIDDVFEDGVGGVPGGWSVLEAGGAIVESGASLSLTAGTVDDDWTMISHPGTLIDLGDGSTTYTASIASMTVGANVYFGFVNDDSNLGVGLDIFSDGQISLSSPDDGPYLTGLQLSGYDPTQPAEFTLHINQAGVRITAVQGSNELDSGLVTNANLSGFDAASFDDPLTTLFAIGNANANVIIESILVRGTERVAETNESPVLSSIGSQTLSEGVQHTFTATASDSDVPTQVLEFNLAGTVPTGATITDVGVFAWTPSEVQQGTFTFDIVVSDGQASVSETITWTVAEVNDDPVLASINNQVVNENELLTFTTTATDSDVPTQNLTFTLNNAPAGATMTPGGVFTWTPGEDDGGKTFDFTVSVSDGITSDSSSSITITVNQVNDPPVLATIENQTGIEHQAVTFTALATDADLPNDTLTFSLSESAPAGANITATGDFSWTPAEDQSGSFTFDVIVSDGQVSDSQTVTLNVAEVNQAPVLAAVGNLNVNAGETISFSVSASDADLPANEVAFGIVGRSNGDWIIDGVSFSWTPTLQDLGEFLFDITATDDGTPSLSDTKAITITVHDAPQPIDGQAEFFAGLIEEREGDGAATRIASVEFELQTENITPSTTAYVMLPGDSAYQSAEVEMVSTDHDQNPATANVAAAYISFDVEQGEMTSAAFNAIIDGKWTVLTDFDGDFAPNAQVSDLQDAIFTFTFDADAAASELAAFPEPTITYPVADSSLPTSNNPVELTWDVSAGTFEESDVSVYTGEYSNATEVFYAEVGTTARSYTTPTLPTDTLLTAKVNTLSFAGTFIGQPQSVSGFGEIPWSPLDGSAVPSGWSPLSTTTAKEHIMDFTITEVVQSTLADVKLEIGKADLNGEIVYLSHFDLEVLGPNHTEATQIDFKRVGDAEFMSPEPDGSHQAAGFNYSTFAEFLAAHNGIHEFVIDVDGDGDYEESFTIDVNLDGFTSDSFPIYPVITSPSGEIDDTTPTISWDAIIGAENVVVSAHAINGAGIENLDELWWTHPQLPGAATSVTTIELPTGQPLLAGVQANFRHDELAATASTDGLVSLSFFTHSIATSTFTIPDSFLIDDDFSDGTGGIPNGWVVLENGGPIVEAGSNLTMTAGSIDDAWTTVGYQGKLIDLQGGPATFTTSIDSLTVGSNAYFGFIDAESDAGVGIDLTSNGQLQLSSPDDGAYHSGLQLANYDPTQPVEISLTIESSGVRIQAVQGDNELDSGLLPNASLNGFSAASLADPVNAIFAIGNANAQVVIDAITVSGTEATEVTADYDSELVLGLAEARDGDDAAMQFAFMELSFEGTDVPFNANSRAYVQVPGASSYVEADGWFDLYDHDGNSSTPIIQAGEYSVDIEQGSLSLADFHDSLRGTWTVYVDFDGDFDTNAPTEEDSDAKFTFTWDDSDLNDFPPAPTLTSPGHEATVDGSDGVTLAWDVPAGSMDAIEVDVQVFDDATNTHYNELSTNGQTTTTPSLPGGTTFKAEVIHVDPNRSFASDAVTADGFMSLDLGETESLSAAFHQIEFTTSDDAFAAFEIGIDQATLPDGSVEMFGYLDIEILDTTSFTNNMQLHIKRPGGDFEAQPDGWGARGMDLDPSEGQSFTDFVASLSGDYVIGIDYDGSTDGNSEFDESFTVTLDLTGITDASLLGVPTINSPADDQVISAGDRSVTLDWDEVTGADFYVAGIDGVEDIDLPAGTTTATLDFLPTDIDLFGFVGAVSEQDRITLADGDPNVDHVFMLGTYRGIDFSIAPTLTDIPIGNSSGQHAGGADVLGGLNYELVGVHRDAVLFADHLQPSDWDDAGEIVGGNDRLDDFWATAQGTGETFQIWDVLLFDTTEQNVDYVHADLTLRYDESLFGQSWSSLSANDIEAGVYAYQYDDSSGSWKTLRLLERDMDADAITVRASEMGPIVLGYHWDGPDVEPDNGEILATVDFEIYHAVLGGETVFGANLDILTDDIRAVETTTIKLKGPLDEDFQTISGGWGWESTEYNPADGQSLADFLDSLEGDYELHYDFAGDGTFEEFVLFNLDTEGFDLTDFAAAPTITAPLGGSALTSTNRTPTVTWNAVPAADFMTISIDAVEPDGIPVDATMFDVDVPSSTTSVTSELLPTGSDFFTTVGSIMQDEDVPVQRGGTGVVDVNFMLGHFSPLEFSIDRAETDVPSGNSTGTFGGGSSAVGGVAYSLTGVASAAKFRAEYQPIGPNQTIMEMVYGSRQAFLDASDAFYPPGDYQQGWRINLVDAEGNDVTATGIQLTAQYDPSLVHDHINESDLRPFQYDDVAGTWSQITLVAHDAVANTMTVQTAHASAIVLGIPFASNLTAASTASDDVAYAPLTTEQLQPIVDEAIARLAATGIAQEQVEPLRAIPFEIVDLDGNLLGSITNESIRIDPDAAGHGWFIDPTPEDDEEFQDAAFHEGAIETPVGMDLLSAVMHELGHALGASHQHESGEWMHETLAPGERLLPDLSDDLLDLLVDGRP